MAKVSDEENDRTKRNNFREYKFEYALYANKKYVWRQWRSGTFIDIGLILLRQERSKDNIYYFKGKSRN